MFYIINRNGEAVGTASGPVNLEDLAAFGSIAIYSELSLLPSEVAVIGFPDHPQIAEKPATAQASLTLSTNAVDQDGDGRPELKADGRSSTTITVKAPVPLGATSKDPVSVTFRTTAGRLSARSVVLTDGAGSVQFTASRETVLVHITATAVGFNSANLLLEQIP